MSDKEVATKFRVVVLGRGRVGKTSIINQFLDKSFSEKYQETVEDLLKRRFVINDRPFELEIMDTSGNISFPAMRRLSIKSANAFVLVYSIVDGDSLEQTKELMTEIGEIRSEDATHLPIPIVVVGNKLDLIDDSVDNQLEADWNCGGDNSRFPTRHFEVSAKTGLNVTEMFESLAKLSNLVPPGPAEANWVAIPSVVKPFAKDHYRRRLSVQIGLGREVPLERNNNVTPTSSPVSKRKISLPGFAKHNSTPKLNKPTTRRWSSNSGQDSDVTECYIS